MTVQAARDALVRELARFPHVFGTVDDCRRCIHCEALAGRADRGFCRARFSIELVPCFRCAAGRGDCETCLLGYRFRVVGA